MRISELSPDLRPSSAGDPPQLHHLPVLHELESAIKTVESLSPDDPSAADQAVAALRRLLPRLPSPLPDLSRLHLWKLAYRLWNACVDLSNSSPDRRRSPAEAELRHAAADLLLIAGEPPGVPSPALKSASFFYKAGLAWHDLGRLDRASQCFEKATDLIHAVHFRSDDERSLALDLSLARARTAWDGSDRVLAMGLLNRAKSLLSDSAAAHQSLAEEFLRAGKHALGACSDKAPQLLAESLDLCEKGIEISRRESESRGLEELRARCLRFLAAERLQGEDMEGVLKCVRVLREKRGDWEGEEEHPSVAYVAMKAWLVGGHVAEAERELRGVMGNKRAAEGVCVAAAEAFVGAAGAERAAGVVAALLGRCRAGGAVAALRVVRRVAEGGGGKGRARVVAEIVADERVAALFQSAASAGERAAMHALLWNCGAEHFRSKDYESSAEMFEKSMLYVPRDEENKSRRSNCFRVLGLCHLGLNQLDRAQEFITEAEKLEPNIKCAFLKFKIFLQKKDEENAIKQVHSMVNCVDFNPEFLTLSTHEAVACQAIPVAVASLSFLLNLYGTGKSMPTPEVALLRNLITLLDRNQEAEEGILNYTRRARTRMVELGLESFFGKGATGSRELSWFAGNSWNMGLKTGKEKKYEFCAEFLELASEFYAAVKDGDNANQAMVCKSLILSVGAMINIEEQKRISLPGPDVKKAMEMLGRASKLLPSISSSSNEDSSFFFLHTFNSYQLLNRLDSNTRSQQLQLIKSYAASKASTPENLLQLAFAASQGGQLNPEAAEFALNACLTALLASPMPDYGMIAIVLRKMAGLAGLQTGDTGDGNNNAAYGVYRQAYQIIMGLKDGEYPIEEGKWLAMTAWNKSGMAVRFRQVATARRWMKMGLDLARHMQGMEKYIAGMEECFANFEEVCGGSGIDEREETGSRSAPIL